MKYWPIEHFFPHFLTGWLCMHSKPVKNVVFVHVLRSALCTYFQWFVAQYAGCKCSRSGPKYVWRYGWLHHWLYYCYKSQKSSCHLRRPTTPGALILNHLETAKSTEKSWSVTTYSKFSAICCFGASMLHPNCC